jgi:hypothetical protein
MSWKIEKIVTILGKPITITISNNGTPVRCDFRKALRKNYTVGEFMVLYNYLLNEGFFPYNSASEIKSVKNVIGD